MDVHDREIEKQQKDERENKRSDNSIGRKSLGFTIQLLFPKKNGFVLNKMKG